MGTSGSSLNFCEKRSQVVCFAGVSSGGGQTSSLAGGGVYCAIAILFQGRAGPSTEKSPTEAGEGRRRSAAIGRGSPRIRGVKVNLLVRNLSAPPPFPFLSLAILTVARRE